MGEMTGGLPSHPFQTLSSSAVADEGNFFSVGGSFGSNMLKMREEKGIKAPSNIVNYIPYCGGPDTKDAGTGIVLFVTTTTS